jgi:hypothetical protein
MNPITFLGNTVNNESKNNIIIQGITDSSITLKVNGATHEIKMNWLP